MMVAEVALALVLLVGAGLMLKKRIRALLRQDPALTPHNVLTFSVNLPIGRIIR